MPTKTSSTVSPQTAGRKSTHALVSPVTPKATSLASAPAMNTNDKYATVVSAPKTPCHNVSIVAKSPWNTFISVVVSTNNLKSAKTLPPINNQQLAPTVAGPTTLQVITAAASNSEKAIPTLQNVVDPPTSAKTVSSSANGEQADPDYIYKGSERIFRHFSQKATTDVSIFFWITFIINLSVGLGTMSILIGLIVFLRKTLNR